MGIAGLGKLTPSQGFLLMLAGYVFSRRGIHPNPTAGEIAQAQETGLAALKRLTQQDFGYDVLAWHQFLSENSQFDYLHPYGYQTTVSLLKNRGIDVSEIAFRSSSTGRSPNEQENLSTITENLRRIQTEGENISGNVAIFIADEERNYYIQFAAGRDDMPFGRAATSLYAEAVGNEVLLPEHALDADQVSRLEALGWNPPRHSPNFYRTWTAASDEERKVIGELVLKTFSEVYGISLEQPVVVEVMIA